MVFLPPVVQQGCFIAREVMSSLLAMPHARKDNANACTQAPRHSKTGTVALLHLNTRVAVAAAGSKTVKTRHGQCSKASSADTPSFLIPTQHPNPNPPTFITTTFISIRSRVSALCPIYVCGTRIPPGGNAGVRPSSSEARQQRHARGRVGPWRTLPILQPQPQTNQGATTVLPQCPSHW